MSNSKSHVILVGTAIVVILASMLWPITTACACRPITPSACLSNLKQNGLAMLLYSGDNDNRFPDRDRWMDLTAAYRKNEGVLHEPTVKSTTEFGYSFNAELSMESLLGIAAPAQTQMIYDSVNYGRNASDRLTSMPSPGRHHGRNATVFADGHVKMMMPGPRFDAGEGFPPIIQSKTGI